MSIQNFIKENIKTLQDNNIIKKILNDIKPIDKSKNLYVFNTGNSNYYKKIYLLLAHNLNQQGYQCSFLYKDDKINNFFTDINIDNIQISNTITPGILQFTCETQKDRHYNWVIKPEKQTIKTNNINFYPFIINTLRFLQQKFNVDFNDIKTINDYQKMIDTCDMFIYYFRMLQKYSKQHNTRICFIGWESDLIPNCVFKTLCENKDNNSKFVIVQRGYPSYHGHNFRESYIQAVNMTNTDRIHFFSVTRDELNNNKTNNKKIIELFENKTRANKKLPIKKQKGTFALFTHLFYDFYDNPSVENTSFLDMCSWIKNTIQYFNTQKNHRLILKPHPLEHNPGYPQKEPMETLNSYIKDNNIKLNPNIILLTPDQASIGDLIPYIDYGLLWGSTVAFELIYKKIPIIIAGYPPYYGMLDIPFAKTKEQYYDMIQNIDKIKVTDEQIKQVINYMDCMLKRDIHVKQLYYDKNLRTNFFDKKMVNNYLTVGDSNINRLVEKIIN